MVIFFIFQPTKPANIYAMKDNFFINQKNMARVRRGCNITLKNVGQRFTVNSRDVHAE